MRLEFGTSVFERTRGDLPELPVVNMAAEPSPTEETGVALQSRPGLSDRSVDFGSSEIKALFQMDGVLEGTLFGVAGGLLYEDGTSIGSISGFGPVSIAGNEIGLFIAAGSYMHYWNGTTLAPIAFPDSAEVVKVFSGGSRIWAIRADTGKIYWTDALDDDIDALDFATAESLPDQLLDGLWIDDGAILFGTRSVEFWPNTGDADLPIQPLEGRVLSKGIRGTGCAVQFGESFAWVTHDNSVCLGDLDTVLSNPGLQAKIEASDSCRLWAFTLEGQEFLALRLDTATYVLGERSKRWSQFISYGVDNWLPTAFANGVFGCSNGKTATWGTDHRDFSGELERRFRAGAPLNGGATFLANISLRTNPGQTPYLTGDYDDPSIEMRLSRDAGQTWGNWRRTSIGEQGYYRSKVQWRSCGMASRPGIFAEFRCTDPVPLRVSDVRVNEPLGGR